MDAEFWNSRWEANQIGFHQSDYNSHLQEYWGQLSLPKGSTVFVPLCGKSRDMLWLLSQGMNVVGVELSSLAVSRFFEENQLSPTLVEHPRLKVWKAENLTLIEGDLFDLAPSDLGPVDAVFDRASVIALPPKMREDYAAHMAKLLKPGVQWLLVTMEFDQSKVGGPPFCVDEQEVNSLYQQTYQVQSLYEKDILPESPRYAEKGVTRMVERVYRFTPKL